MDKFTSPLALLCSKNLRNKRWNRLGHQTAPPFGEIRADLPTCPIPHPNISLHSAMSINKIYWFHPWIYSTIKQSQLYGVEHANIPNPSYNSLDHVNCFTNRGIEREEIKSYNQVIYIGFFIFVILAPRTVVLTNMDFVQTVLKETFF